MDASTLHPECTLGRQTPVCRQLGHEAAFRADQGLRTRHGHRRLGNVVLSASLSGGRQWPTTVCCGHLSQMDTPLRCLSGSERMPRARKIEIAVVNGDVLEFEADVLVLKYAQALYGADRAAWGRLEAVYPDIDLPEVGDHRVVESEPALSAAQVLFIVVEPLHAFGYAEIREFSRRALSILSGHPAGARHIALTIHGPGYGLDEVEAFRSEVAGVIEAMTAQEYPKDLVRITFVERDKRRSKRLSRVLAKVFPDGNIATSGRGSLQTLPEDTQKALRSAGYGSGAKPHVFVAMPFVPEMDELGYALDSRSPKV